LAVPPVAASSAASVSVQASAAALVAAYAVCGLGDHVQLERRVAEVDDLLEHRAVQDDVVVAGDHQGR